MDIQAIQSVKQRFGIIGNSPKLNYAIQVATQVAATELSVLITGENGSGKESFSKIIHQLSHRKHGKMIAVNCGAIPENTIDSELFGHVKGAFTGSVGERKGFFEVADGGTIFLDEIGEMPLDTQKRLLRVLESKEFYRMGDSNKLMKTDVRVVAATNVDLLEAIDKGKFREDLYYRLNTVPIVVPPLRERGNDILLLFRKFASDFSEKYKVKPVSLTPDAQQVLMGFRFPGNVRQLRNLVEQISVLELERSIDAERLSKYLPNHRSNLPAIFHKENEDPNLSERDILYKVLFDMKKDMNDLKKMVLQMAQGDHEDIAPQLLADNAHLFHNMDVQRDMGQSNIPDENLPVATRSNLPSPSVTPPSSISPFVVQQNQDIEEDDTVHYDKVEDITDQESESLSLQDKEKELIIKALNKHNNKRKYAAQDLGISERTLYRKIQQYEIYKK